MESESGPHSLTEHSFMTKHFITVVSKLPATSQPDALLSLHIKNTIKLGLAVVLVGTEQIQEKRTLVQKADQSLGIYR